MDESMGVAKVEATMMSREAGRFFYAALRGVENFVLASWHLHG
jgi:hypothetical protein